MTMLQKIEQLLTQANPCYQVIYEESSLMNVRADQLDETANFVHIEEFRRGIYIDRKYGPKQKQIVMQLYFSKITQMHANAIQRECLRNQIETEIVLPFISLYEESPWFSPIAASTANPSGITWAISYPLPRFDANEVSIMLEFTCAENVC